MVLLCDALTFVCVQPGWRGTHNIARSRVGLVRNAGTRGIRVNSSAVVARRARFAVNVFWARLGDLAVLAHASMHRRWE